MVIEWGRMEILSKLFGSTAKVKVLRLFLFNPHTAYDIKTVAVRSKLATPVARKEVVRLEKIGFVRRKTLVRAMSKKKRRGSALAKKNVHAWTLNERFTYLQSLQNFLLNIPPLKNSEILKRLSNAGKLKLVVIAGVFIQDPDSRVDLLVVGDNLKRRALERAIRTIESELGKELKYVSLDTSEFRYRLNMYDKLIRDILDYPHEKIIDKLGLTVRRLE
jgi:predicted nucleotidyltransferase